MAKKELQENIHAKRNRIKKGSGEKLKKKESKGSPTHKKLKRQPIKNPERQRLQQAKKQPLGQRVGKKQRLLKARKRRVQKAGKRQPPLKGKKRRVQREEKRQLSRKVVRKEQ